MEASGDGLIVVDTNVIAYLLIQGGQTSRAREILVRDPRWYAPSFWRIEFLNVLMNYSRHLKLPDEDVRVTWMNSFHLPHLEDHGIEPDRALEAALRYKISGYDALFVALAKDLNTVCVTRDNALRKAVPSLVVTMDEFLR
jgi:predicted nucleic acid-binding protein